MLTEPDLQVLPDHPEDPDWKRARNALIQEMMSRDSSKRPKADMVLEKFETIVRVMGTCSAVGTIPTRTPVGADTRLAP